MKQKIKEKEGAQDKQENDSCPHYWVIEIANGPKSVGKCKYCSESREFYNAFPDFNPNKKQGNPLELPRLPKVKVDKESKS